MIVISSRSVIGRGEIADRLVVDEHLHVLANPALLVDHAEADAGIATIEIGEQRGDRVAVGLDDALLLRVRAQRARNANLHARSAGSAYSTE